MTEMCIRDRFYPVPRHGFARELPMRVTEQGEDFVTLTLTETPETTRLYPFSFALSVTHRLCGDGFETCLLYTSHRRGGPHEEPRPPRDRPRRAG